MGTDTLPRASTGPISGGSPLAALLRLEARPVLGPTHAATLGLLVLVGLLDAFWLPNFPEPVFRFFRRALHLEGWPEIALANDLTGLFFAVYWMAMFDALAIVVVPREERSLDLLLSKPIRRRDYLLARLAPVLARATLVGGLGAAAHWAAMAAAGLAYGPWAFAGASAVTVGAAVLLVALSTLLTLGARDSFTALLVAFVPVMAAMIPGAIYLYRPDVFEGAPAVRDLVAFPMNLIWFPAFAARWGLPLGALMLALAATLAIAAGRRLERREVA